jgi:hypothetical protein
MKARPILSHISPPIRPHYIPSGFLLPCPDFLWLLAGRLFVMVHFQLDSQISSSFAVVGKTWVNIKSI